MQVLDPAVGIELRQVAHELVALVARFDVGQTARQLADGQVGDRTRLQEADDSGEGLTPRDAQAHARAQQAADVVGGEGEKRIGVLARAFEGQHDRALEPGPTGQFPAQLDVMAAWRPDLHVDDALVPGALQVARDRRRAELEVGGDLGLVLAVQVEGSRHRGQLLRRERLVGQAACPHAIAPARLPEAIVSSIRRAFGAAGVPSKMALPLTTMSTPSPAA